RQLCRWCSTRWISGCISRPPSRRRGCAPSRARGWRSKAAWRLTWCPSFSHAATTCACWRPGRGPSVAPTASASTPNIACCRAARTRAAMARRLHSRRNRARPLQVEEALATGAEANGYTTELLEHRAGRQTSVRPTAEPIAPVAGVAALIASQLGGAANPGAVQALISRTADSLLCPTARVVALYAFFPAVDGGAPQSCTGGPGNNSWFGGGQLNALTAVLKAH